MQPRGCGGGGMNSEARIPPRAGTIAPDPRSVSSASKQAFLSSSLPRVACVVIRDAWVGGHTTREARERCARARLRFLENSRAARSIADASSRAERRAPFNSVSHLDRIWFIIMKTI